MENIDLLEKLRKLEAEIDDEAKKINKETAADNSGNWGITLAGGGGKGSYQIGVWQALRKLNIEQFITAVSGSSVGALNAALMAMGDLENACDIWENILPKEFLDVNDSTILGPMDGLYARTKSDGICNRDGLIRILENKVDLGKLASSKTDTYACISQYPSDSTDPFSETPVAEYIRLCEVSKEDIKHVLLASSAMPYIYPPEIIYGKLYRDGGLADNVPIKPLAGCGVNRLIIVTLGENYKIDTSLYPCFDEVLLIKPSRDIGSLLDGTLDFSRHDVKYRMLLGYYDTLRIFRLRDYKAQGIEVTPIDIARMENEDYDRIMDELRRGRVMNEVNRNLDSLKSIISKYDI